MTLFLLLAYLGCLSFSFVSRSISKGVELNKISQPELIKKIKRVVFFIFSRLCLLVCMHLDRVLVFNQLDAKVSPFMPMV